MHLAFPRQRDDCYALPVDRQLHGSKILWCWLMKCDERTRQGLGQTLERLSMRSSSLKLAASSIVELWWVKTTILRCGSCCAIFSNCEVSKPISDWCAELWASAVQSSISEKSEQKSATDSRCSLEMRDRRQFRTFSVGLQETWRAEGHIYFRCHQEEPDTDILAGFWSPRISALLAGSRDGDQTWAGTLLNTCWSDKCWNSDVHSISNFANTCCQVRGVDVIFVGIEEWRFAKIKLTWPL